MEGHIMMAGMNDGHLAALDLPALSLLVSGGHTEIVLIRDWMQYELVGATRDDAAGEAFDKSARILGLSYPGGPEISRMARHARDRDLPRTIELPRPMLRDGLEFSFSGLKTAVLRATEGKTLSDDEKAAMAREIEDAIVDVLVAKTERASEEYGARTILVGGGVSANAHLREKLTEKFGDATIFPTPELATDNAIMIGLAGYFHAQKGEFIEPATLIAKGNLQLAE